MVTHLKQKKFLMLPLGRLLKSITNPKKDQKKTVRISIRAARRIYKRFNQSKAQTGETTIP